MSLIESYDINENGFHPVLIRDSWQVAKLNYADGYHIDLIKCLVKHQKSDRAISLLVGNAQLIVSSDQKSKDFQAVTMERGTSYNIPQNVWYAIAMSKGCQLLIVERPHAQIDDVTEHPLTEDQLISLREKVNHGFK